MGGAMSQYPNFKRLGSPILTPNTYFSILCDHMPVWYSGFNLNQRKIAGIRDSNFVFNGPMLVCRSTNSAVQPLSMGFFLRNSSLIMNYRDKDRFGNLLDTIVNKDFDLSDTPGHLS